jgi:hypothetical protein
MMLGDRLPCHNYATPPVFCPSICDFVTREQFSGGHSKKALARGSNYLGVWGAMEQKMHLSHP